MTAVEAVYENGVFRPVAPVALAENQRVRLQIEPVESDAVTWFAEMRAARERLAAKYGSYPDTTPDIAEDRRRDA